MADRAPALRDFWQERARSSFWPTREIGYRAGALLAWIAVRLGLTPNMVTLLSLATAAIGLPLVLVLMPAGLAQGVAIFLCLFVSYGFDCADGLLARVKGGSRFGAFLDKLVDVLVLAIIIGGLGAAAGAGQSGRIGFPTELAVAFALGVRLGYCVLVWLREFEGGAPDRLAKPSDGGALMTALRLSVGTICDQIFYIATLTIAYASGCFWDVLWVYHFLLALILLVYLLRIKRQMEGES